MGPLLAAMKHPKLYLRTAAAKALGALGDPRAIQPLRSRLAVEKLELVRKAIEKALARLEAQQ